MNNSNSMTKREVAELLAFIKEVYPNFEVTQSKIDTWYRLMNDQNPRKVMRKAELYVKTNQFPPTIAHLSEVQREEHSKDIFRKIEEWEKNAQPRS